MLTVTCSLVPAILCISSSQIRSAKLTWHILRRVRTYTAFIFPSFLFCNTLVSLPYNGVGTNTALWMDKRAAVLTFCRLINTAKALLTLVPAAIFLSKFISYLPSLLHILPKYHSATSFICSNCLLFTLIFFRFFISFKYQNFAARVRSYCTEVVSPIILLLQLWQMPYPSPQKKFFS